MMTVRIKQEFRDKDNFNKVYHVGDICEFERGRASELVNRGLVESFFKESEPKPKRTRTIE